MYYSMNACEFILHENLVFSAWSNIYIYTYGVLMGDAERLYAAKNELLAANNTTLIL